MNYYEIRDRVPCSEIDALTVEAARVWLERNGWATDFDQSACDFRQTHYENGPFGVWTISGPNFPQENVTTTILHVISVAVESSGKRAHVVIAEIRAIAEWQKRCAEWVAPKRDCSCLVCRQAEPIDCRCMGCEIDRERPRECPTCYHRNCPRATDHRNECSGSNEAGQEGSRYA